jgi:hypothetical protein
MDRRERYDRTVTESIGCKRTRSGITVSGITVLGITVLGYWPVTTGSTRWEAMPGVQNIRCVAGT